MVALTANQPGQTQTLTTAGHGTRTQLILQRSIHHALAIEAQKVEHKASINSIILSIYLRFLIKLVRVV